MMLIVNLTLLIFSIAILSLILIQDQLRERNFSKQGFKI